jgi:hypothetical protein
MTRFSRAIGSILVGFVCLALHGCAQRSVTLIHPGTGATARCEEAAYGVLAANVGVLIENCLKEHEGKGYLSMEKLTAQQRSELERRGLMSKPSAPMGY